MNEVTQVAGTYVGFYKSRAFIEIDCPHCGHSHVLLLPDALIESGDWLPLCMPCTGLWIILCGILTVSYDIMQKEDLPPPGESDNG
jgi:hypothetical protein